MTNPPKAASPKAMGRKSNRMTDSVRRVLHTDPSSIATVRWMSGLIGPVFIRNRAPDGERNFWLPPGGYGPRKEIPDF